MPPWTKTQSALRPSPTREHRFDPCRPDGGECARRVLKTPNSASRRRARSFRRRVGACRNLERLTAHFSSTSGRRRLRHHLRLSSPVDDDVGVSGQRRVRPTRLPPTGAPAARSRDPASGSSGPAQEMPSALSRPTVWIEPGFRRSGNGSSTTRSRSFAHEITFLADCAGEERATRAAVRPSADRGPTRRAAGRSSSSCASIALWARGVGEKNDFAARRARKA